MVQIELERHGDVVTSESRLSVEDVADMIRRTGGDQDTAISLSMAGLGEVLRIAIDDAKAFVGLETPDGVLQFVPTRSKPLHGTCRFSIGGQPVEMEERYIADIEEATEVAKKWVTRGDVSSLGSWEKR
jgi:hypothetical protein